EMMANRKLLLLCSLITVFLVPALMPLAQANSPRIDLCEKVKPCQLLDQSDASRLLGQPVRLMQNTASLKGDVLQCVCAYIGISVDKTNGQNCVLYFSFEQKDESRSVEQARQLIASTKESNAHDSTVTDLSGILDE